MEESREEIEIGTEIGAEEVEPDRDPETVEKEIIESPPEVEDSYFVFCFELRAIL